MLLKTVAYLNSTTHAEGSLDYNLQRYLLIQEGLFNSVQTKLGEK